MTIHLDLWRNASAACALALFLSVAATTAAEIRGAGTLPSDEPLGSARTSTLTALSRIDRAMAAHLAKSGTVGVAATDLIARSRSSALVVSYEGTWEMEAHLHHPYETTRMRARLTLVDAGPDGRRLDWTTWSSGPDTVGSTETDFLLGARVIRRDDQRDPFLEFPPERATTARFVAGACAPWTLLEEARGDVAGLRWIGVLNPPGASTNPPMGGAKLGQIASASVGGRPGVILVGDPNPIVRAVEVLWPHPRLGDVTDWATYDRIIAKAGVQVADSLTLRWHGRDDSSVMKLTLRGLQLGVDATARLRPDSAAMAPPDPRDEPLAPRWVEQSPGVYLVELPNLEMRTMLVEFADHLVAIEAPLSSAAGEAIVATAAEHFPQKPIRYVLFGHYHPHYTGGLRAFMAAGATVVTTPGNEAFVRDIAQRPFRLKPDQWARPVRKPGEPMRELKVEVIQGSRTFTDGTQSLQAIDIGAKSNHTDEYLVFALPESGLLFEGDLGYFMSNGKLVASRRAAGMLEAVEAAGVHPTRIMQAWPVNGMPASITREELDALLAAPKK